MAKNFYNVEEKLVASDALIKHYAYATSAEQRAQSLRAVDPSRVPYNKHIQHTMESFDYRRASKEERKIWLDRIRRLYYGDSKPE